MTEEIRDKIVEKVVRSFIHRSNVGIEKYGTTMMRDDLTIVEWIQHAQEEMMDGVIYLEKIKDEMKNSNIIVSTLPQSHTNVLNEALAFPFFIIGIVLGLGMIVLGASLSSL